MDRDAGAVRDYRGRASVALPVDEERAAVEAAEPLDRPGRVPSRGWGLVIVGLALGFVIGWHRGKLIHIERNAETGELRQRASPLALVLLAAIVVLKVGARQVFGESAATQPGSGAMLLTDAFIGFALGLLSATRAELYLRGRQLLSAA